MHAIILKDSKVYIIFSSFFLVVRPHQVELLLDYS